MREPVQIRSEIYSIHGNGRNSDGNYAQLKSRNDDITEQALIYLNNVLDKTTAGAGDLVSALRKYRTSITPEVLMKIKKGKFVKMITLYSDGNTWCAACGQESCNTQMHRVKVHEARQEVKMLREMGIIVQGIGFTQAGSSIKLICEDPSDPQAAVVVDDSSKAIFARQQMLRKHLQKLSKIWYNCKKKQNDPRLCLQYPQSHRTRTMRAQKSSLNVKHAKNVKRIYFPRVRSSTEHSTTHPMRKALKADPRRKKRSPRAVMQSMSKPSKSSASSKKGPEGARKPIAKKSRHPTTSP
jgi:nicotinamide mononucleotide adenylyltransferase